MSSKVEERVVQMKFDNDQFEAKAQNTISTLGTLSEALKMTNANKGFESVQNGANKINFEALNKAIETVNYRFSTLGMIATNVLSRVTNAAVDTGKRLVDAMTIEPVKEGFAEYELMMDSVKRILNSAKDANGLPVTLDAVNARLDELNTYADRTIYSFADMTTNIGKFTNAGVDLDTSVKAIQGIANEAAVSGANTQEASRAMYNFAQALSAGYVKLIDWKSIENANMATVEFKDELIKTALELGTVTKEGDKYVTTTTDMNGKVSDAFDATTAFNESLSNQWMTSEVLTQTLARYADETTEIGKKAFKAATEVTTFSKLIDTLKEAMGSGWTHTWQAFIGDFEEAKQLWTGINDVLSGFIDSTSDARNEVLKLWKSLGGRDALIEGLTNVWRGLVTVLKPVADAFHDVLSPLSQFMKAGALLRMTKSFRDFTAGLKLNWKQQERLKSIAKGLFSVLDLGKQVISAVARSLAPIGNLLKPLTSWVFDIASGVGYWISKFAEATRENDTFFNIIQKGLGIFKPFIDLLQRGKEAFEQFTGIDLHLPSFQEILNVITRIKDRLAPAGNAIKNFAGSFGDFIQNASQSSVGNGVKSVFSTLGTALGTFIQNARNSGVLKSIGSFFSGIGESVGNFVNGVKSSDVFDSIGSFFEQIGPSIKTLGKAGLDTIVSFINALGESLSGLNPTNLLKIVEGGLVYKLIKSFDGFPKSMEEVLDTIKKVFGGGEKKDAFAGIKKSLSGLFDSLSETVAEFGKGNKIEQLKNIAKAIALLTGSLWVLSSIDSGKLGVGIIALGAIMQELSTMFKEIDKTSKDVKPQNIVSVAGSMVAMSVGILILAAAVSKLSRINSDELTNGMMAVVVLMGMMTLISKYGGQNFSGKGLVALSVAILIMQKAITNLATLDENALIRGTEVVSILIVLMGLLGKYGGRNFSAKGFISLSVAILIMQRAISNLAALDEGGLLRGVEAVSILIAMMALVGKYGDKDFKGKGFLSLSVAILILQKAASALGEMDDKQLVKGVAAVGALMAVMTIVSKQSDGGNLTKASVGILIISVAMKALASVIKSLGTMNIDELINGIVGLGSALLIIAAASNLMNGSIAGAGSLLVMAVAINLLTPALVALANVPFSDLLKSLAALAIGFTILFAAGMALGPMLPVLLGLAGTMALFGAGLALAGAGILAVSVGLAAFAATAVVKAASIATAFHILVETAVNEIPTIVAGVINGVGAAIEAIGNNASKIVEAFKNVAMELLKAAEELIPEICRVVIVLILTLLELLDQYTPLLVNALVNLAIDLLDGFALAIYENTDRIIAAVRHLLGAVADFILATIQEILKGLPVVGSQIDEALGGMREELKKGMDPEEGKQIGAGYMNGVSSGVDSKTDDLKTVAESAGTSAKEAVGQILSGNQGFSLGNTFSTELGEGILNGSVVPEDNASAMVSGILNNTESELSGAYDIGAFLPEGAANGVSDNAGLLEEAARSMGYNTVEEMNEALGVSSPSVKGYEAGKYLDEGVALGVSENQSVIANAMTALGEGITGLFQSLKDKFTATGVDAGNSYAEGITGSTDAAIAASQGIASSGVSAVADYMSLFGQNGIDSGAKYARSLKSTARAAGSAGSAVGKTASSGVGKAIVSFSAVGRNSGTAYTSGISSKNGAARSAGNTIGKSAASGAASVGGFYEAGRDSSQGYINGLMSKAREVANKAAEIVKNALRAAKDAIDSNSPSKLWAELGEDSDRGYILGIEDKAKDVNEATANMALGASEAFKAGISRAAQAVSDDAFVTPTISPVFDSSSLYGSVDYLNDVLNGNNLSGMVQATVDANTGDIQKLVDNTNNILNAIKEGKIITLNGDVLFNYVNRRFGQA